MKTRHQLYFGSFRRITLHKADDVLEDAAIWKILRKEPVLTLQQDIKHLAFLEDTLHTKESKALLFKQVAFVNAQKYHRHDQRTL